VNKTREEGRKMEDYVENVRSVEIKPMVYVKGAEDI